MSLEWCSSIGENEVCGDAKIMVVAVIIEIAFYFFVGSLGWRLNKWRTDKKRRKELNNRPPPF